MSGNGSSGTTTEPPTMMGRADAAMLDDSAVVDDGWDD
jgi:hypothetical protein